MGKSTASDLWRKSAWPEYDSG